MFDFLNALRVKIRKYLHELLQTVEEISRYGKIGGDQEKPGHIKINFYDICCKYSIDFKFGTADLLGLLNPKMSFTSPQELQGDS